MIQLLWCNGNHFFGIIKIEEYSEEPTENGNLLKVSICDDRENGCTFVRDTTTNLAEQLHFIGTF